MRKNRSAPGTPDHSARDLAAAIVAGCLATALFGCSGSDDDASVAPANEVVRSRLDALAPAANLGHRGTGVNTPSNPFPENSLAAYAKGISEGADGIELDVELTADGELVIMHDDTLDRTTTCTGCVSALDFQTVRGCRLLNGTGAASEEPPPTLEEVYSILPANAFVNIELKAYDADCLTASSGPDALAAAAVAEVKRLGTTHRTLFSSFDAVAAGTVKDIDPQLYSALLVFGLGPDTISDAVALGLDAIHPFFLIPPSEVARIRDAGLQVSLWTVDTEGDLQASIDKGVTAIITDEPDVLAGILDERR